MYDNPDVPAAIAESRCKIMSRYSSLQKILDRLCEIVDALSTSFPLPHIIPKGDGFVARHHPRDRNNGLACYLKAIKICSTLNGALALLEKGYVQEAYALARVSQDQVDDIHFLGRPRGEAGSLSEQQKRALDEFFQEEFTDAANPVATSQDRDRVPRDKVRAAVHRDSEDPSRMQEISRALYRVFSGYVHGAYDHIMELYSDASGRYDYRGTFAHVADAIDYFPNFLFQASLAFEDLVDRSSRDDLLPRIKALRKEIAAEFDVLPSGKT